MEEASDNLLSVLVYSLHFKLLEKVKKYVKFRLTSNQDLLHAPSGTTDDNSGICRIKWITDARDSPNFNNLETNLYFVLITTEGIFNFSF